MSDLTGFIHVSEITTVYNDADCNSWLRNGWVLLAVLQMSENDEGIAHAYPCYVLGKPQS